MMNTDERIQFEKEVGLDKGQDYELSCVSTDINWLDKVYNDTAPLQNYELSVNRRQRRNLNYYVSGRLLRSRWHCSQGSTIRTCTVFAPM